MTDMEAMTMVGGLGWALAAVWNAHKMGWLDPPRKKKGEQA